MHPTRLMRHGLAILIVFVAAVFTAPALSLGQTARTVSIETESGVLVVDGRRIFPIGLTMPPAHDAKSPTGEDAFTTLRKAGATFIRSGPQLKRTWNDEEFERERNIMDAAANAGLLCMPWLKELSGVQNEADEARLRKVLHAFKDHPGLGVWKGEDEPKWGKRKVAPLARAREIIHEVDPNHPVWIVQAPRGTVQSLRTYDDAYDIAGVDVYPIGYPPGEHSLLPNNDISVVGDHINIMREVAGAKPVWATLQIAWSGVIKEGKTLRMPTFAQERYMAYQAIALGARGIIFFGGHLPQAMPEKDQPLGWNWTFFNRVLEPLLAEIGSESPLQPALVAPESSLPIRAADVEMCVREVGNDIFIIATYRSGDTKQIRFLGLPEDVEPSIEVMFESPRTLQIERIKDDAPSAPKLVAFQDWFAPFDVHVYRLRRSNPTTER